MLLHRTTNAREGRERKKKREKRSWGKECGHSTAMCTHTHYPLPPLCFEICAPSFSWSLSSSPACVTARWKPRLPDGPCHCRKRCLTSLPRQKPSRNPKVFGSTCEVSGAERVEVSAVAAAARVGGPGNGVAWCGGEVRERGERRERGGSRSMNLGETWTV